MITETLQAACAGLMFPSESEFPLDVFTWKDDAADLDERTALRLSGHPAQTPIERVDLDEFFKTVVEDQDWHGEVEKEQARKFRNLLHVLKDSLSDLRAFRAGTIEIDVYIAGRSAPGEWIGVQTKIIET